MQPQIIIVADDLTGAADSAAGLAQQGLRVRIVLDWDSFPEAEVLAFSTESRGLRRAEAVREVRTLARRIRDRFGQRASPWMYKKIDSTLRGHPAGETDALMTALGIDRALIAPAFPAQGRTTLNGLQLVYGIPVEQTHFSSGVTTSDLRSLFASTGRSVGLIDLSMVRDGGQDLVDQLGRKREMVIADAETEGDLQSLAEAAGRSSSRLLCGSAGLLKALGCVQFRKPTDSRVFATVERYLDTPGEELNGHGQTVSETLGRPALVVAGSRNPCTIDQIEFAERQMRVVRIDLSGEIAGSESEMVKTARDVLRSGEDLVLTTAGAAESPLPPLEVAKRMAAWTAQLVRAASPGILFLTGGDIARAVCAGLGVSSILLLGELVPGIPWGRLDGGMLPGLVTVTKAGGFGDRDAIVGALRICRGHRPPA